MKPRLVDELDFESASKYLVAPTAQATRNEQYYLGEHLQGGAGWIGPRPAFEDPDGAEVWARIVNGFVSKNIIKEIIDRIVSAILGQDPDWSFTFRGIRKRVIKQVPNPDKPGEKMPDPEGRMVEAPLTDEERQLLDGVHHQVMEWWTRTVPLLIIKAALRSRLWGGRGFSRIFPPRALEDKTRRTMIAPEDVPHFILSENPVTHQAAVITDRDTGSKVGLVLQTRAGEEVIEVSYVDDNNKTIIFILRKDGADSEAVAADDSEKTEEKEKIEQSDPLNLFGHIPLFALEGEPVITDSVVQNNQLCNMALTMMGHNVVEAGFSELALTNVELETAEVVGTDGVKRMVPKGVKRGAGRILDLKGVQSEDAEGKIKFETPGAEWHDPAPVATFIETKDAAYVNCLEEVHQLHALLSKDAAPSGESRIQALSDFIISVQPFKDEVDQMGRSMLEAALGYIITLTGEVDKYKNLRAVFNSRIYVGKLTSEERNQVIKEYTDGMRSKAATMVLLGIDDPEAMQEAIDQELQDKAIQDRVLTVLSTPPPDPNQPPAK